MNPRPTNDSDRDAMIDELARLESADPSEPSAVPEPSSTVRELKAELDTLVGELRLPAGPDPFAAETGLQRARELVLAIGVEPASQSRVDRPALGRIGPYELLKKLGEGGMGAVYQALHVSLEKIVALKVLPRDRMSPQAISRFKREMKAVGKLDHPNIVRATDAGEADGDHFLVMEYVDGVDLAELLRRVGPLSAADACELVRQAAVGLQHAYQRGMVHRDIKPNNIMLAWSDEHAPTVKILDLGLALFNEPQAPALGDLTATGQMMGTLEYMSPEQGLDTHNVDIRADVYSLGATLYKLLCGKAPFSGERFNTPGKLMVALTTETPPSIGKQRADLAAGLVELVDRMLAREPADRPATPAEVAQALAPLARGADLPRLAGIARPRPTTSDGLGDHSIASTDQFLSSPSTGTLPTWNAEACARESTAPSPARPTSFGTPTSQAEIRKPNWLWAVGLLGMLVGAMLYGGQIFRLITNRGELIIEVDDAAIEVRIVQNGIVVQDKTSKREFTLNAVNGEIEVLEKDGIKLTTKQFALTRGRTTTVKVTLPELASARRSMPKVGLTSPIASPDRRAAEWVLSIDGTIHVKDNGQEREISAVGDLPHGALELTNVNLEANPKVTDAGLGIFHDCQHLTSINLRRTQVSDAALVHFRNSRGVTSLDLGDTTVSDAGLEQLAAFPQLELLKVMNSQVTKAGVKKLSAALPACKIKWDGSVVRPSTSEKFTNNLGMEFARVRVTQDDPASRDYHPLATGRWLPVKTSPKVNRNAKLLEGRIEIENGHAHDPSLQATDVIVRAKVQKLRGQNVMLTLRDVLGVYYSGFYHFDADGTEGFGVGMRGVRFQYSVKQHFQAAANVPEGEFFELAFAAVGDLLTIYANGKQIGAIRDSTILRSGGVAVHTTKGKGVFKDFEVMVLDQPQVEPAKP